MLEILEDTIIDTLKLIPFLFITYLLMEYIENKTGDKAKETIKKSGKFGPLIGGIVGIFPQCGFSVSATNLYAARVISIGTLIAVFLSTSDEMLPIFISKSFVRTCFILCHKAVLVPMLYSKVAQQHLKAPAESPAISRRSGAGKNSFVFCMAERKFWYP